MLHGYTDLQISTERNWSAHLLDNHPNIVHCFAMEVNYFVYLA